MPKVVMSASSTGGATKSSHAKSTSGTLALSCGSSGMAGQPFLLATAAGGTGAYTLSATPVPAIPGIGYQTKGVALYVASSPFKAEDTATFNVAVADSAVPQNKATATCSIEIVPAGPGSLDVECPGVAYVNVAFPLADVQGGTEPYSYKTAPTLPLPLGFDQNGIVTGASTAGRLDNVTITVTDKNGTQASKTCSITVKTLPKGSLNCSVFPVGRAECVGSGPAKNTNINTFWGTNGGFVFFNQIKSIYNAASNSETVSTDVGTLNFPIGFQLNIGTNIQAGATPPTPVSTGAIPTLSPTAAAQAAQNMLYGGTIYASGAYPLLALGGNRIDSAGNWGGMLDVAVLEGVDIQSFKAGTSASASSPSSHSNLQLEGYLQMNSTNIPTGGGGTIAGALFGGGSYGYSYTSHQYIRDCGIKNASNRLGQLSAGILLNGVAKLAFSKAFGPPQTYYDGTITPTPTTATTINNFKAWSFELTYQSAAPASK
jgi:hypothetical protein